MSALILINKMHPDVGITDRIILPLVPFTIIVLVMLKSAIAAKPVYLKSFFTALFALFLLGQVNNIPLVDKSKNSVPEYIYAKLQDPVLKPYWTSSNTIILTNEAQYLGGYLLTPVIGLANKEYSNKIWNEKNIKELKNKYHINRLVLFSKTFNENDSWNDNQIFFKKILHGTPVKWLQPLILRNDIQIYKI